MTSPGQKCAKLLPVFGAASLFCSTGARAERVDLATFTSLAKSCGPQVAPLTLAALAKTESGFDMLVIRDNTSHRSYRYSFKSEAARAAESLIARGHSIDVGLMQINSANLRRLRMTARDALDACRSISAAAAILYRNYAYVRGSRGEQAALLSAISMYNTGSVVRGFRNGYVRRVQLAAGRLTPVADLVVKAAVRDASRSDEQSVDEQEAQPWDVWRTPHAPNPADIVKKSSEEAVTISGGSL
jgi:type IV secretion system protein VirB1